MATAKQRSKRERREQRDSIVPSDVGKPETPVLSAFLKAAGGSLLGGLAAIADSGPAGLAFAALVMGAYEVAGLRQSTVKSAMEIESLIATLSRRIDAVNARVTKLRERDPGAASNTEIVNTLLAAAQLSEQAMDQKMRDIAGNAAVNAFDQQLYDSGLTRRLFLILKDLDYGDVVLLRRIEEGEMKMNAQIERERAIRKAGLIDDMLGDVTTYEDLVEPWHNGVSLESMHADRLKAAGLIALLNESSKRDASRQVAPTELGHHLLRLARDPDREPLDH